MCDLRWAAWPTTTGREDELSFEPATERCSPHTRPLSLTCTRSAGLQDVSRETYGSTTAESALLERAARGMELNRCAPHHAESRTRSGESPSFGSGEADYVRLNARSLWGSSGSDWGELAEMLA